MWLTGRNISSGCVAYYKSLKLQCTIKRSVNAAYEQSAVDGTLLIRRVCRHRPLSYGLYAHKLDKLRTCGAKCWFNQTEQIARLNATLDTDFGWALQWCAHPSLRLPPPPSYLCTTFKRGVEYALNSLRATRHNSKSKSIRSRFNFALGIKLIAHCNGNART